MIMKSTLFLLVAASIFLSSCFYVPAHETGSWHWHRCDWGQGCHHY